LQLAAGAVVNNVISRTNYSPIQLLALLIWTGLCNLLYAPYPYRAMWDN